jgi:hypothetical protein
LPPVSGPTRIVALLLLAMCAIGLTACGGAKERDEKNAYVKAVNSAQNEFSDEVASVAARITNKSSSRQDRKTLADFQSAIDDVVSQLKGIKVPGVVATEHKQLVTAMSGFGAQIRKATNALRNPNSPTIAQAQEEISTATQQVNAQIDSAIAAINSKLAEK